MTMDRETDRQIQDWLLEGPSAAPPDLLASAFSEIPAKHIRHGRLAGIRSLLMISRITSVAVSAVAIVVVVALAAFMLPRAFPSGNGIGGSPATASPSAPATTAAASSTATDTPTPTFAPTVGPMGLCDASNLVATITGWSGAAGSRIAEVSLHHTGLSTCLTPALDETQLLGPDGSILIGGSPTSSPAQLVMNPEATFTTMVRASNYCGPAVTSGPVTVAFVLRDQVGPVVASPLTPTDMSGLPPCNSAPGTLGAIEMQPWAP